MGGYIRADGGHGGDGEAWIVDAWEALRHLPLRIEGYRLEGAHELVSSGFERATTTIVLEGDGVEGRGEDVTYATIDHERLQAAGPVLPLAGAWTLERFSRHLDRLDLFPEPPVRDWQRSYRRWAFESAALDLALSQAGTHLAALLGRTPKPVRFVVSLRLGSPPSTEPIRKRLAIDPKLHFKLDPTCEWDEPLIEAIRATAPVDIIDFKGCYHGTPVDQPADAALYERVIRAFPEAWIEDPVLDAETEPVLAEHWARVSWDAPIHGVADIEALSHPPRALNIKPSRFGTLHALFATYAYCETHRILCYGGGQFELGIGRAQNQLLASLFHPEAPNDLAPHGYNLPDLPPTLPKTPLPPSNTLRAAFGVVG